MQLQRAYGPKRIKVVGIAYEQVNDEDRTESVADAAQKLGINYPVLLGATEGISPLRDALHVQVYPTMILLDRQGRVLSRQEGATAQNFARLDRAVQTALQPDRGDTARR